MRTDQKSRKKASDSIPDKESLLVKDLLEKHSLQIKALLAKDHPISFDQYIGLLEEELDRLKGLENTRIREKADPVKEANRFHGELLFKSFHEMRNPLHAIMGYTSLVLRKTRDQIPRNHQENLEKVIESADRLKELVDNMVAYYRQK